MMTGDTVYEIWRRSDEDGHYYAVRLDKKLGDACQTVTGYCDLKQILVDVTELEGLEYEEDKAEIEKLVDEYDVTLFLMTGEEIERAGFEMQREELVSLRSELARCRVELEKVRIEADEAQKRLEKTAEWQVYAHIQKTLVEYANYVKSIESGLRDAALQVWSKFGRLVEKKSAIVEGIGIRESEVVEFKADELLAWLLDHFEQAKWALGVDSGQVKKHAELLVQLGAPVKVAKRATATIATNLPVEE
jgi:hypothetical protein